LPAPYEEKLKQAARARAAHQRNAAVRAADDPKELARVARIFKVARERGLIDDTGNLVGPDDEQVAS
jgi:hypothetical protein